jgi:hypothetical protein
MRRGFEIEVIAADRSRLEAIVADRHRPQKQVWRTRIIRATADGCGTAAIMRRAVEILRVAVAGAVDDRRRRWSAARQEAAMAHSAVDQAVIDRVVRPST